MMKLKYLLFLGLLFFALTPAAHAISDDFKVRLLVGDDTTSPTTPSTLVAVPVAETQIDLSWGASTDDFIFGGYQVFRDSLQIATTTLTSYSDSGLIASTTYTYFVRAYDSAFNISSSSNTVSTTTLSPTPIPPTSTSTPQNNSEGGLQKLELDSFSIIPSVYDTYVSWKTKVHAQFEFRWGRSTSYELGFVTSNLFTKQNSTFITDLQPGTVYEYQLVGHDKFGRTTILKEGQFSTQNAADTIAPANVSNLRAVANGASVQLSWNNPTEDDFSYVRVVRNYLFYPTTPTDGYLIYQDKGNFIIDKDALQQKKVQYYTVFSYDTKGNISSGAIVGVRLEMHPDSIDIASSSSLTFDISDIELLQGGVEINSQSIDADTQLTFRILYEKLPEHLKTIVVSLTYPEGQERDIYFLMKINKDKTYYEATVAPLRYFGQYPLTVSVFDYNLEQLYSGEGSIYVVSSTEKEEVFGIPLTTSSKMPFIEIILFIWLMLLLILTGRLFYRVIREGKMTHNIHTHFDRSKLTISILICMAFGGASAYILTQLGSAQFENVATSASVFKSLTPSGNVEFAVVAVVITLLVFILIEGAVIFLKKRK